MTMATEQVIPVPPELNSPQSVEIDGKTGLATLSPFDFPRYARAIFREFEDKTCLAIRLMYEVANDEATEDTIKEAGVALAIGKESGRVFSIFFTMKQKPGASTDLGPYLARVHECLVDLKNKTVRDSRRYFVRKNAHYQMMESLVPAMARQAVAASG